MIDRASAVETVVSRMKKAEPGHGLDVRTYKRDRGVRVRRMRDDRFEVVQDGFGHERFEVDAKKLKKLLKRLFRIEFPRSNRLRVYALPPQETGQD